MLSEPTYLVFFGVISSRTIARRMPSEPNTQNIMRYIVIAMDVLGRNASKAVPSSTKQYTFEGLQLTALYMVRAIACARDNGYG